jgi:hypothetical protein
MARESYRNVRKNNYTQVGNSMLWDKNLTLQAKGLLTIFLSNSNDWELNMKEIIKRSNNGRDGHYKVVNELIDYGYFARVEIREGRQFSEIIYLFSDCKEDVTEELKQFRDNKNAFINLSRKAKKKDIGEIPENQETEISGFTGNQETEKQVSQNQDTADQYNNNNKGNNKGNNTNLNNTKDNNIYLSVINEMYENKSLPIPILKMMSVHIDRLTDDNIHPFEIEAFYNDYTEHKLDETAFAYVLGNVLKKTKKNINDFQAVMKRSAKNYYKEYLADNDEETPY